MLDESPALSARSRLGATLATPFAAALIGSFALTSPAPADDEVTRTPVQIVALDECDPTTFNAVLGPDFCKNVALALSHPSPQNLPSYSRKRRREHLIPIGTSNPTVSRSGRELHLLSSTKVASRTPSPPWRILEVVS